MDEKVLRELELIAARQGVNRVSLINEILIQALKAAGKLSLLAFGLFHLCQSPADWHAAALAKSLGKAVALIASLA